MKSLPKRMRTTHLELRMIVKTILIGHFAALVDAGDVWPKISPLDAVRDFVQSEGPHVPLWAEKHVKATMQHLERYFEVVDAGENTP